MCIHLGWDFIFYPTCHLIELFISATNFKLISTINHKSLAYVLHSLNLCKKGIYTFDKIPRITIVLFLRIMLALYACKVENKRE